MFLCLFDIMKTKNNFLKKQTRYFYLFKFSPTTVGFIKNANKLNILKFIYKLYKAFEIYKANHTRY